MWSLGGYTRISIAFDISSSRCPVPVVALLLISFSVSKFVCPPAYVSAMAHRAMSMRTQPDECVGRLPFVVGRRPSLGVAARQAGRDLACRCVSVLAFGYKRITYSALHAPAHFLLNKCPKQLTFKSHYCRC